MRHIHNTEMTRPAFERPQTWGEECANSVSHGMGLLAALGAAPVLIVAASGQKLASLVGATVFAATMVLLYFTSMLHHALPPGRAKRVFLQLDYCAIFLFIAGSYAPFALGALRGRLSHPWASTGIYLAMGWLVLIDAVPLVERVPTHPGWQSVHRCHFRLSTAPKRPPPNKSAFAAAPLPKP